MSEFRKLSDKISIDDSGINEVFLVNGQWQFTLPDGLSYEIDGEFTFIEGGFDLSGSTKPLVLKEGWSLYDQSFCAAVEPHYSFTGDHMTIIDCKYDNRFGPDNGMNSQRVIIDEPGFYVDLVSVNTWPFGVEAQIRVRGDDIDPFNITMMVKPEGDEHWQHIADYFREIAGSICIATKTTQTRKAANKKNPPIDDSNCIMSGTVLERYIGWDADVVLPEGITELADNIFSGRDGLRSIVIPEGVTTIGSRAFENCFNLESVILPQSIRRIGDYAFVDCHKLQNINLDGDLECIAGSVFSECFKLENVTIPASVEYIDAFAFKNCREFTKIIIPDGATSIGFTAFAACTNLEYLYIPASVTGIFDNFMGQTPFDGCSSLTIYCPERSYAEEYAKSHSIRYVIDNTPKTDGKSVKKSHHATTPTAGTRKSASPISAITETPTTTCTKVKKSDCSIDVLGVLESYNGSDDEIILPSGIEEIGSDAFSFNKTLRIVVIPEGVREIGSDAFWGCEALEQVFLPSTLEKIEYNAFRSCESLKEIIIPDGVWSIGMDAFTGCKNLKDIYVPDSVISVETDAFYTFNDDTVIHTPQYSSAETYAEEHDMRVDHRQAPVRAVPRAKRNTSQTKATTAKTAATTGDPKDFVIEEGVLKEYKGNAEQLLLVDGIHTVGERAFRFNSTLKSVVIPEGVHTIAKDAFSYCMSLETITLPSTLKYLGGFGSAKMKKIQIPNGVEVIGYGAFDSCNELKEIILPPSVTTIENLAFSSCGKTKNIYVPESVTQIDDMAFWHSGRTIIHVHPGSFAEEFAQKNKVKFDNNVQVYLDALEGKTEGTTKKKTATAKTEEVAAPVALKEPFSLSASGKTLNKYEGKETVVTVPDGVTEIDSFAFSKQKVTVVTLPDSVKKIGKYAFTDCSKLVQINIPASVTSVGENAFNQCSSLTEIVWPGNVKTIPANACWHCDALAKVVIEEGITEIGGSAFSFCPKLKDLHLPQSINKIGDHALLMSGSPTLHVYLDSYAEKYAKENNLPTVILLTPEQEAEKKRQEEARRIAEEKYAAELKAWEQNCGEIRTLREQRVSELLEEKRVALKNEAQSAYDAAVAAANKRKEAAQQKKSDAEMRLSTLGIFKFAEKKAAKTAIEEATGEIQAAETALVTAKQTFDKDLASIPATINSRRYMVAREVEYEYPLPAKPSK